MITNASLNFKINEVKVEIPFINILGTTASLTTAENTIPNVSDLVKKVYFHGGIKDTKDKYFTTSGYNNFRNNILDTKKTAKKLVNESSLNQKWKDKSIRNKRRNKKVSEKGSIKSRARWNGKTSRLYLSLCVNQIYFNNDKAQICLILLPFYYRLKRLRDTEKFE